MLPRLAVALHSRNPEKTPSRQSFRLIYTLYIFIINQKFVCASNFFSFFPSIGKGKEKSVGYPDLVIISQNHVTLLNHVICNITWLGLSLPFLSSPKNALRIIIRTQNNPIHPSGPDRQKQTAWRSTRTTTPSTSIDIHPLQYHKPKQPPPIPSLFVFLFVLFSDLRGLSISIQDFDI